MSFDAFGDGFIDQSNIQFSKEENLFLQSKISLLDPTRSSSIPIGTALQILKYTALKSNDIQKIIRYLKLQGKKLLSYDEMKKIFRGVSLVQKGHEPSLININANIKLKMPIFYDDDSDQEPETPHLPAAEKKVETTPKQILITPPVIQKNTNNQINPPPTFTNPTSQKSPVNQPPSKENIDQFQQFTQIFSKPPQPKPQPQNKAQNQPPAQPRVSQQNSISKKFASFQANWNKLKTNNSRIDGGQVKTLCKNLAQKNLLSKAWKLCCISQPGTLSKGQFYVFLEIIESNKQMPQALTQDMKTLISQIDKTSSNTKNRQKQTQKQKLSKTSVKLQSSTQLNLGASQIFQNFGKNIAPKSSTTMPQTQPKFDNFLQVSTKFAQKMGQTSKQTKKELQTNEQQLLQVRRQQQVMNNMMGQIDQFFTLVNSKNNSMRTQIDELKTNQKTLNDRLNNVCVAMNQIIIKQNSFIEELMLQVHQNNQYTQERVSALQDHVQGHQQHSHAVQNQFKQQQPPRVASRQNTPNINKAQTNGVDRHIEKESTPQNLRHNNQSPHYQHEVQRYQPNEHQQEQDNKHHQEQPHQNSHLRATPQSQASQMKSPRQSVEAKGAEQPEQTQQQVERKNRVKITIMQVIQLINYFNPIPAHEYPELIQKITSMPQEKLYTLHQMFIEKYQKQMQNKRMEQERLQGTAKEQQATQQKPKTAQDEFNSSNFNAEQPNDQGGQQDFFNNK